LGCGLLSSEPQASDTVIEINHTTISIDPALGFATVAFVIRNTGDESIYLSRCGDRVSTVVERFDNGDWRDVSGAACLAIYDMSPLLVHAGGYHRGLSTVHESGQYRFRFGVTYDSNTPYAWRTVSPRFTVR
jgi:hypothetical protein